MKHLLFIIVFLLTSSVVFSQTLIEPCKYGQPLINAIQASYSPTQTMGYGPARDTLYSKIDNVGNDLFGIYTDFKVTLNPNQDPSVSAFQNGNGINAEHVYPQSKGAGSEPMRSDLHNIYPSRVSVNSARGSCPFDDIIDTNTDTWFYQSISSSSIPSSNIDAYSEKDNSACEFEPRESKKGDIARAVFYFYATYQNIANSADPNFFDIQKDKLLEWHYADLPDSTELARSAAIAQRQGNENPFAIDTSLARRAFFMPDGDFPDGDANCYDVIISNTDEILKADWIKLQTNFVANNIILESQFNEGVVEVYNLEGRKILATRLTYQTVIDVSHLVKGLYLVHVRSKQNTFTMKIVKN